MAKKVMKKCHSQCNHNTSLFKFHLGIIIQQESQKMGCFWHGDAGFLVSWVTVTQKIIQSLLRLKTWLKFKFHKWHAVGSTQWRYLHREESFLGGMAKMDSLAMVTLRIIRYQRKSNSLRKIKLKLQQSVQVIHIQDVLLTVSPHDCLCGELTQIADWW